MPNMLKKRTPVPAQLSSAVVPPTMVNYLPHYLSRLMNTLNMRLQENLRPRGIMVQQFRVMQVLDARGTTGIGEIAADAVIEQSVVSRIVDKLRRDGLVIRRKRAGDGRNVDVALTPAGRKVYESVVPFARAIVDDAVGALTPEECDLLHDLLRRTFEHVNRPYAPWVSGVQPRAEVPPQKTSNSSRRASPRRASSHRT